jgi:hypothetical protein
MNLTKQGKLEGHFVLKCENIKKGKNRRNRHNQEITDNDPIIKAKKGTQALINKGLQKMAFLPLITRRSSVQIRPPLPTSYERLPSYSGVASFSFNTG